MKSDGELLLEAIIREPEEDVRRLAYADWLDEHGQAARAEFIRVQCEAMQLYPLAMCAQCGKLWEPQAGNRYHDRLAWCPRCAIVGGDWHDAVVAASRWGRARRRAEELLRDHGADWSEDINNLFGGVAAGFSIIKAGWLSSDIAHSQQWRFTRGFISDVSCTAADWLAHADEIRERQPVTRVRLATWPEVRCVYYDTDYCMWELCGREANGNVASPAFAGPPQDADPADMPETVAELLALEWPGVTFELPQRDQP